MEMNIHFLSNFEFSGWTLGYSHNLYGQVCNPNLPAHWNLEADGVLGWRQGKTFNFSNGVKRWAVEAGTGAALRRRRNL